MPYKQLGACAYDGGGGGVVVTDFRSGWQVNTLYPVAGGPGTTIASIPDVILGNKTGSAIDFILAVAFVNNLNQVELDYFDVHYISHTIFTIKFNSYQTMPLILSYKPLRTVHIDIVAKSSSFLPYGLPFCDRFFVTYDTRMPSQPNEVNATYGSLNAYNALVAGPVVINGGCPFAQDAWQPDVAGIERTTSHGIGDIACLTWVIGNSAWPNSNYFIYYSEWDPALTGCAAFSAYTQLDGTSVGPAYPYYSNPRIDANDNYLTNGSTGYCQSKIVCEAYNWFGAGAKDVGIYDYPVFGGVTSSSWITLTTMPFPGPYPAPGPSNPYNHYRPAVAFGQNYGNYEFMETECTNLPSLLPGATDFFMMSPIDNPCGSSIAPYPYPFGTQYYFEVNSLYPAISSNYANSVSTPCNNVSDTSLVAWTNDGLIYYKRSGFGGGTGYAYKTKPAASGLSPIGKLLVFPNPADDHITVTNPADVAADRYSIKNVLGQVVLEGRIAAGDNDIDVRHLAAGNYIISAFKEGTPAGNTMFVKK